MSSYSCITHEIIESSRQSISVLNFDLDKRTSILSVQKWKIWLKTRGIRNKALMEHLEIAL